MQTFCKLKSLRLFSLRKNNNFFEKNKLNAQNAESAALIQQSYPIFKINPEIIPQNRSPDFLQIIFSDFFAEKNNSHFFQKNFLQLFQAAQFQDAKPENIIQENEYCYCGTDEEQFDFDWPDRNPIYQQKNSDIVERYSNKRSSCITHHFSDLLHQQFVEFKYIIAQTLN
jgi:hypothetical protein